MVAFREEVPTYFFIMSLFHSLPNYGFRISPAHADMGCDHSKPWDVRSCDNYCNSVWGRVPLLNKQWTRGACYDSNCVCSFNNAELGKYTNECVQESVYSSVGSKKTKADRTIQAQVGRLDTKQRFEMFKKAYGRKYNSSEEKRRFQIFANNLVKIDNLMAKRKGNVVYGVGPFADLTSEEYMASIGAIRRRGESTRTARLQPRMLNSLNRSRRRRSGSAPPTPTPRRAPSQQSTHRERGNSVPPSYRTSPFGTLHYVGREPQGSPLIDWRVPAKLYPPTEAQVQFGRDCAACYSFAPVGAVEILLARAEGSITLLSKQTLIDCDTESWGCEGGTIANSMEYIKKYGVPTAIAYPYTAMTGDCKTHVAVNPYAKIAGFIRTDPRKLEEHLRLSPLPTDVHAKAELQFYVSGVFESDDCPDGPGDANHAVVIVGHYKDAWILRDSAPSSWGLQGHFLMQKGICGIGSTAFESFEIYNPYQPKMKRNTYSFP